MDWASEIEEGLGDKGSGGSMGAGKPEELVERGRVSEGRALSRDGRPNVQRVLGEESDGVAVRAGQEASPGGPRRSGGLFGSRGTSETVERPGVMLFPGGSSMIGELWGAESQRSLKLEWGCSGIVRKVQV